MRTAARVGSGIAVLAVALFTAGAAAAEAPPASNFATHCASCHGGDRLGGSGPALLPENLERLRKPAAAETIAKGRIATQMPAFADKLSAAEIDALVAYVYTPPPVTPQWGEREIAASRVEHVKPPTFRATAWRRRSRRTRPRSRSRSAPRRDACRGCS